MICSCPLLSLNKRVQEIRAVATFEATEAAASVVFRTVALVKTITSSSRILQQDYTAVTYNRNCKRLSSSRALRITGRSFMGMPHHVSGSNFPVLFRQPHSSPSVSCSCHIFSLCQLTTLTIHNSLSLLLPRLKTYLIHKPFPL